MKRKNANTLSPRDRVENEVFRLQELARSALSPTFTGERRLPGTSVPSEEDALRRMLIGVGDTLEDLQRNVIPKLRDPADRDHLYHLLYYFITAARLIGSRAQVSQRQKNFFKYRRASDNGKRGGQLRVLEAEETWRAEVLQVAIAKRQSDPYVSKKSLSNTIVKTWRLSIEPPAQRTVLDYLSVLEKDGRLPVKARRRPVKQKPRSC